MISLQEAAVRLGLHVNSVRIFVRDGRIKGVKLGRDWRIAEEEIERVQREGVPEREAK